MKHIVIIDNKIDEGSDFNSYLQSLNAQVIWQVMVSVPRVTINGGDILFIHINNPEAINFKDKYCKKFKEIYITSAGPSSEQLKKIKTCDKVKLFDLSIPDQ